VKNKTRFLTSHRLLIAINVFKKILHLDTTS